MNLDNVWIELRATRNGKQKLSCQVEGKHYVGFLLKQNKLRRDGSTYPIQVTKTRLCDWNKCPICYPGDLELF